MSWRRFVACLAARSSSSTADGSSAPRSADESSTSPATFPGRRFSTWTRIWPRRPGLPGAIRCRPRRTSRGRPRAQGSARACSSSPTGTWAAPSGSGGCCATSATTTARCSSSRAGSGRFAQERRRSSRPCSSRRPRDGDTIGADELASRLEELVVVDARLPERYRGEENPIDKVPGRIPGAVNAPWNEPLPKLPPGELVAYCGSGVTSCVTLAPPRARGTRGQALSRLLERVGAARPARRARLGILSAAS